MRIQSCYIAYDRYPGHKGSATHMDHMIAALKGKQSPVLLLSLPGNEYETSSSIVHHQFSELIENPLKRSESFSQWCYSELLKQEDINLIHFRDIWGGMAALKYGKAATVFEVNAVPSIELPYRYPHLSSDTLDKFRAIELECMLKCSAIVTPSKVTAGYMTNLGVEESKISVISNGTSEYKKELKPADAPENYFIYFGALQSWQGVNTLFKAMQYLQDMPDFHLVICCSQREKQVREIRKFAVQMEIDDRILWKYELDKPDLYSYLQYAIASLAPLSEVSRNIIQGCSPLKVLESLGNGIPVIASDLPVIKEIMEHKIDGILVQPDRPAELARAMRSLVLDEFARKEYGTKGKVRMERDFLWKFKEHQLTQIYSDLVIPK